MLTEIQAGQFASCEGLFQQGFEYSLSIKSVLFGENLGRVFVDDPINPSLAFAMTVEGFYLAGDPDNETHVAQAGSFLRDQIFTGKEYLDDNSNLTLAVNHPGWEPQLSEMIPSHEIRRCDRRQYICEELTLDWREHLSEGYTLQKLDHDLLSQGKYEMHPDIESWTDVKIGWGSIENFLDKGMGVAVLQGREVASFCNSDCRYQDQIDLGIITAPQHRRKGLAAAAAAATVDYCFQAGFKKVGWHCDAFNTGSWKTAQKVGFKLAQEYTYYFYIFDLVDHLADLGWDSYQRGNHDKTRHYYEQVFEMRAENPDYYYHLAALVWAEVNDEQKTLRYLQEAASRGWPHHKYTGNNSAFEFLHGNKDWLAILKKMEENANRVA